MFVVIDNFPKEGVQKKMYMPSGGRKLEWFMLKYIFDMQLDTADSDFLAFRKFVGLHASFTQLWVHSLRDLRPQSLTPGLTASFSGTI